MEIALRSEIPTYSGGLGVLAGDSVRSAADLSIPLVAVSLASRGGFFHQEIDGDGNQIEREEPWDPARWCVPLDARVAVEIGQRRVWVGGWLYVHTAPGGGRLPIVLLDTQVDDNGPEDRDITRFLYGGDTEYRLKQEIVLGIGGVRMLDALGFRVRQYHMNEGHSALLTLQLLRRHAYLEDDVRAGESAYDVPATRALCNFTTHTPVGAGHDRFPYPLVERLLGDHIDLRTLRALGGPDELDMTYLALNLSEYVNGVAKRHAEVSERLFPGYHIRAISNGVHPSTWTHPAIATLFDQHVPTWRHEPELLVRADCCVPADALWRAHVQAKQDLIRVIAERCRVGLDPDRPILGFARRMTQYKRPELLFTDLARLRRIARDLPFQVVLAGKAHPRDQEGKALIQALHRHSRALSGDVPVVYLPNYDMAMALRMTAGVDVWINTPQRPLEASGTSGMKAAFNGVPSLSVLDGWWIEGCIEGVTGWAIGDASPAPAVGDADSLYQKLGEVVLPLYHRARDRWIGLMQATIAKNASVFNSHRMMRRYTTDAYIP
jgi:starch phosphorylase